MAQEIELQRIEAPFETIQIPGNETTPPIRTARTRWDGWFKQLRGKLRSKGTHWLDASIMIISNQMSQMLLLLPSCVAKLGWWRATLAAAIFGLLSCWTAHLVQFFYFRYYRSAQRHDNDPQNKVIQWDNLLSKNFQNNGQLKKLGIVGMGFNCVCLLTRSIIQLTYAVSIIYFINNKLEKRNWTYALASCCMIFAIVPTLRNYRIFSILGVVTATVAVLTIAVASWPHQPVQGVKHSAESSSMWSLAWVCSTIVYAIGDTSSSVETLVTFKEWDNQNQFKYAFWGSTAYTTASFWGSTAYTTALSLVVVLRSYWVFGDQLSKIPLAAQPCVLALLPPYLRDIASISLLILELVAIGYSLYPLITCMKKVTSLIPYRKDICHFLHCVARAFVVILVFIIAAAIPFSGSMEITSLVGSLIFSQAIYTIPAAVHMLYVGDSQHRMLSGFSLITSYMITIIQFAGVFIFVTMMGSITSINKVFRSHHFHRSDFWNSCYLCADLQLPPSLGPIRAPALATAPARLFVHCIKNSISMSNRTLC